MHADKIGAKKGKQSFLMNPQVLTWAFCFSWNSQKITLSHNIGESLHCLLGRTNFGPDQNGGVGFGPVP